jgi:hypothetical protein
MTTKAQLILNSKSKSLHFSDFLPMLPFNMQPANSQHNKYMLKKQLPLQLSICYCCMCADPLCICGIKCGQ